MGVHLLSPLGGKDVKQAEVKMCRQLKMCVHFAVVLDTLLFVKKRMCRSVFPSVHATALEEMGSSLMSFDI